MLYNSDVQLEDAAKGLKHISISEYLERNHDVPNVFRTNTSDNIKYLNTLEIFCDELNCYQFNDSGTPLYSDFNHVEYYGAQLMVSSIFYKLFQESE